MINALLVIYKPLQNCRICLSTNQLPTHYESSSSLSSSSIKTTTTSEEQQQQQQQQDDIDAEQNILFCLFVLFCWSCGVLLLLLLVVEAKDESKKQKSFVAVQF